jgi:hypothetical protein
MYSQNSRSKSFAAFRLKDDLNYLQFLLADLPGFETSRGLIILLISETVDIQLPVHNSLPSKENQKTLSQR